MSVRMSRVVWLVLALVSVFLGSPALACSPPRQCRTLGGTYPVRDATGTTRKLELRVSYATATAIDSDRAPTLETDDGEIVPTRWESARSSATQLWVGRPMSLLAGSTHYRLRHPFHRCAETDAGVWPCANDGLCVADEGDVISEFTTSDDTGEAVLPTPPTPRVETRADVCTGEACCGPYSRCVYDVALPGRSTSDLFRIERNGQLQAYVGQTFSVGSGGLDWFTAFNGVGEYQVIAVDKAGNRSEPTALVIPACDLSMASGHTSNPDAGTTAEREVDDGCALGGRFDMGLWISLVLGALRRRRKRSP